MSDYKSLTNETIQRLDNITPKDETGKREETYSQTINRLLDKYEKSEAKRLIKKAN